MHTNESYQYNAEDGWVLGVKGTRLEIKSLEFVLEELYDATSKFAPFNSAHEGYAVILEELHELWDEIRKNPQDPSRMREEVVQVAAMAIRFMLDSCPIKEGE